jgi:hypothetical protein
MVRRFRLVPIVLLSAVGWAFGHEGNLATSGKGAENPNQALAQAVARELESSPALGPMKVQVWCQDGRVELRGVVADAAQSDKAMQIARKVSGVRSVANRMTVSSSGVIQAQYQEMDRRAEPGSLLPAPAESRSVQEPLPSFRAALPPVPPGGELPAPMPPYAWPAYAPYNNFSRVAYPVVYPKQAFPLIGPVYPFPKVPLSWRKVTLEYDDGHWWLQTHGGKNDWWVLRYW